MPVLWASSSTVKKKSSLKKQQNRPYLNVKMAQAYFD
jgi:hypothetical protein